MLFKVYDKNETYEKQKNTVFLIRDNWDDYHYKTSFYLYYCDNNGVNHFVGGTKIGYKGMTKGRVFDSIPKHFNKLNEVYFSLGADEEFYDNLNKIGKFIRIAVLEAINDIAYNLAFLKKYIDEDVMRISILRSVSLFTVEHQFHRMAHGGVRLTKFCFSYLIKNSGTDKETKIVIDVDPESSPPSNVHVLIGRNGIGKTYLIKNLIKSIRYGTHEYGVFEYLDEGKRSNEMSEFANILCIAFSPFDDFSDLENGEAQTPYTYIGLNKHSENLLQTIEDQFVDAFSECRINERKRSIWKKSIDTLKSDPAFSEENVDAWLNNKDEKFDENRIRKQFSKLSSGHKVVLLIVTCCVNKIEERSIVFIDEPENHLHPPLLSALIRSISDLLTEKNGVAIISTHSPIVLQEVPQKCVWKLRRHDKNIIADRLEIESFGSGIGTLTNEVFGLEITNTGFHNLVQKYAEEPNSSFESIMFSLKGQLGNEAQLLLRTLIAIKNKEDK